MLNTGVGHSASASYSLLILLYSLYFQERRYGVSDDRSLISSIPSEGDHLDQNIHDYSENAPSKPPLTQQVSSASSTHEHQKLTRFPSLDEAEVGRKSGRTVRFENDVSEKAEESSNLSLEPKSEPLTTVAWVSRTQNENGHKRDVTNDMDDEEFPLIEGEVEMKIAKV